MNRLGTSLRIDHRAHMTPTRRIAVIRQNADRADWSAHESDGHSRVNALYVISNAEWLCRLLGRNCTLGCIFRIAPALDSATVNGSGPRQPLAFNFKLVLCRDMSLPGR